MVSVKEFIKAFEGTYDNEDYCNVVGWDIELENFAVECDVRGIPKASQIYTFCIFKGVTLKGILFDKKFQNKVEKIVYHNGGYGRLVVNAVNPFSA